MPYCDPLGERSPKEGTQNRATLSTNVTYPSVTQKLDSHDYSVCTPSLILSEEHQRTQTRLRCSSAKCDLQEQTFSYSRHSTMILGRFVPFNSRHSTMTVLRFSSIKSSTHGCYATLRRSTLFSTCWWGFSAVQRSRCCSK